MNRVRLAFCVLAFCGLSVAGLARQDQATPVVTAAAPADKVRFAGSPAAVQLRIEVRSAGGSLVYDSDWKDGNIFDWMPQDSSGQPLAYGVYRLVMRSKNLAGQTSEKQASLHVDSGGMAVDDEPSATPKITLTAHDGETGELITTSGDLSFRFGDFLNRKDTEVMRLTADGKLGIGTDKPQAPLDVNGLIRTSQGIQFPDGTILTTAAGLVAGGPDGGGVLRQRPSAPNTANPQNRATDVRQRILLLNPPAASVSRLTPRPNFAPAFQFQVGSGGVSVGTTDPTYRLDVTGIINTGTEYDIGGLRFAHNSGPSDTFVGLYSGNLTTSGGSNTAIGTNSLQNNTTGCCNTATGVGTLVVNSSGNGSTAIGWGALNPNNADYNTAVGYSAMSGNTTGTYNTAIGPYALSTNTSGSTNIAIGTNAGVNLTTGNANIDIANLGVAGEANTTRIGTSGSQTRAFIAGIYSVTTGTAVPVVIDANGQLGTTSSSRRYKFDIADMGDATSGLMRLRPVTFRYIAHGDNAPIQYGLIAEEVAEVYPEMVTRDNDGQPEAVMYQFLAPMLLNEVQKEHRQIEEQQKTIEEQQKTIDAQSTTLAQLVQRVEQLERKRTASQ